METKWRSILMFNEQNNLCIGRPLVKNLGGPRGCKRCYAKYQRSGCHKYRYRDSSEIGRLVVLGRHVSVEVIEAWIGKCPLYQQPSLHEVVKILPVMTMSIIVLARKPLLWPWPRQELDRFLDPRMGNY